LLAPSGPEQFPEAFSFPEINFEKFANPSHIPVPNPVPNPVQNDFQKCQKGKQKDDDTSGDNQIHVSDLFSKFDPKREPEPAPEMSGLQTSRR